VLNFPETKKAHQVSIFSWKNLGSLNQNTLVFLPLSFEEEEHGNNLIYQLQLFLEIPPADNSF